jgi:four helix bundle protein
LRSATSVAANYRATARARSHAEFVAKIGTVVEEADESVFWLEMLIDCALVDAKRVGPLMQEATELLALCSDIQNCESARPEVVRLQNHQIIQSSNHAIIQLKLALYR